MILSCICGGWIEIALVAGGFTFLTSIWNFLSGVCKKLGCKCKCHLKPRNNSKIEDKK